MGTPVWRECDVTEVYQAVHGSAAGSRLSPCRTRQRDPVSLATTWKPPAART